MKLTYVEIESILSRHGFSYLDPTASESAVLAETLLKQAAILNSHSVDLHNHKVSINGTVYVPYTLAQDVVSALRCRVAELEATKV